MTPLWQSLCVWTCLRKRHGEAGYPGRALRGPSSQPEDRGLPFWQREQHGQRLRGLRLCVLGRERDTEDRDRGEVSKIPRQNVKESWGKVCGFYPRQTGR